MIHMSEFIQTLENEHKEILEILHEIDGTEDVSSKKILVKKLMAVIAPHLKKEDDILYPSLMQSDDESVRRMASIFASTMGGYAKKLEFVADEIISTNIGISDAMQADYEKIRDRIIDRITVEEVTIFPAYDKIFK